MAIREYGESLLQDVRDRKQAEAQRIRKRQKRGELLGLAGMGLSYLGASKMKSQWDTFTKNEDVMNTNIMINSATKNNKDISDFTNTIKGSGKSQQDYFLDRTVDETLDSLLLKEENIKYNKNKESREAFKSAFAPQIRELQEIKDAANKSLDIYNSSVVAQEKFKTSGTKKDAEKLSKERLGNRITSLFNQGDRQQEAVESYRNSLHAKSAGDLAMFDQLLKETGGDYVTAYKLADDFQLNAKSLEQLNTIENKVEILNSGIAVVLPTTTNSITGEISFGEPDQIDLRTEEDQVKAKLSEFNPALKAKEYINSSGRTEMIAEGFTMTPTTIEQVNKNNKLFDQYFASHPVVTLSLEQTQAMNSIRKATEVLKSSTGWQESETSILRNSAQIKRIQNAINDKTPQLENESNEQYVIRLKNLYNEDKNIIDAKREVALQINNQNEQLARINEQYKLDDPDDAETAFEKKDGVKTGSTGTGSKSNLRKKITVTSTTGKNIEVDSNKDSEEKEETSKTLSIKEVANKYKVNQKTVEEMINSVSKIESVTQQGFGVDPVDIVTDEMLFNSGYLEKPTRSNPYSTSFARKYFARRKFVKDLFKDIRG